MKRNLISEYIAAHPENTVWSPELGWHCDCDSRGGAGGHFIGCPNMTMADDLEMREDRS